MTDCLLVMVILGCKSIIQTENVKPSKDCLISSPFLPNIRKKQGSNGRMFRHIFKKRVLLSRKKRTNFEYFQICSIHFFGLEVNELAFNKGELSF